MNFFHCMKISDLAIWLHRAFFIIKSFISEAYTFSDTWNYLDHKAVLFLLVGCHRKLSSRFGYYMGEWVEFMVIFEGVALFLPSVLVNEGLLLDSTISMYLFCVSEYLWPWTSSILTCVLLQNHPLPCNNIPLSHTPHDNLVHESFFSMPKIGK